MLPPETIAEISALVRSGFYGKEQLMVIFGEEMYEPGELEPVDISAAIDVEMAALEADKQNWPAVTDCDHLDAAFAAMQSRGIIAMQNAGYTQSDGFDDFRHVYENHPNRSTVIGYCYYHGQDLERAVHGDGLYLAFGPVDVDQEESEGPKIGQIVREELQRVGFKVDWNGTFGKRIHLPNLVWQRR